MVFLLILRIKAEWLSPPAPIAVRFNGISAGEELSYEEGGK
jgi:hypothetical protein